MKERVFSNMLETSVEEGEYPPRFPESHLYPRTRTSQTASNPVLFNKSEQGVRTLLFFKYKISKRVRFHLSLLFMCIYSRGEETKTGEKFNLTRGDGATFGLLMTRPIFNVS
jgi:hypothetical protein